MLPSHPPVKEFFCIHSIDWKKVMLMGFFYLSPIQLGCAPQLFKFCGVFLL